MIVETFMLINHAKKLQEKIKNVKLKENYSTNDNLDGILDILKTYLILVVLLVLVFLGLGIWALVDASKNCGKSKLIHMLLLIFLPGYLPIYFILRLSGVVCKKQSIAYNYN